MRLEIGETYWDDLYHQEAIAGVLLVDIAKHAQNLKLLVKQAETTGATTGQALPPALCLLQDEGIKASWAVEIGCGSGSTSLILQMMNLVEYSILVDLSRSALLYAQRLFNEVGQRAFFIQADALNSPVRTAGCDLAHSGGLIEHFVENELTAIVREHCRVADYVVIAVPANRLGYWIGRTYVTLMNGMKWPFGFERPLGRDQLFHLIKENGWRIAGYRSRNILQAVFQRIASRFSNNLRELFYRMSASSVPSLLDMEHIVLAVQNKPRHRDAG